jgi:hypothetical protein
MNTEQWWNSQATGRRFTINASTEGGPPKNQAEFGTNDR